MRKQSGMWLAIVQKTDYLFKYKSRCENAKSQLKVINITEKKYVWNDLSAMLAWIYP